MTTRIDPSKTADRAALAAELGQRVAFWLRSAYGRGCAKHAAREFGVSVRTAEDWLAGHCPTSAHLQAMAHRWGWRFVQFAFEGACGTPAIDTRITALETELEALKRAQALDRLESDRRSHLGGGMALGPSTKLALEGG